MHFFKFVNFNLAHKCTYNRPVSPHNEEFKLDSSRSKIQGSIDFFLLKSVENVQGNYSMKSKLNSLKFAQIIPVHEWASAEQP